MVKKFLSLLCGLILIASLGGCSQSANTNDKKNIKVGVTPFPHKDIMNVAKDILAKEGYTVEIVEFNDYVQPNVALEDGSLDANFFQHVPYLEETNKEKGFHLTWTVKVHIEPLGLYSNKVTSINDLKDGAEIAIPNDATNEARALRLLEKFGLIKVNTGELVTVKDITENKKNFKFDEIDAAQLPRTLVDVDAAVINTNFAAEANLNPSKDALIIEDKDSPYANVLAVKEGNQDKPYIKALSDALNSPEVKQYIVDNLESKGIVPAF
ncbi:MAG: MetQ/NlpA family ABC transporter substrate-binding protein [Oscillospiraceae bacterium]|nr:MetQ/NlpA family ABC transporter substrate-binding protein [Oscillospiraceae bacterium]